MAAILTNLHSRLLLILTFLFTNLCFLKNYDNGFNTWCLYNRCVCFLETRSWTKLWFSSTFHHTLDEIFFQFSILIWQTFNSGRLPKLSLLYRTLYASQCVLLAGWTFTTPTSSLKTEYLKLMSNCTPSLLTVSLVRMFSFNAYFIKKIKKTKSIISV